MDSKVSGVRFKIKSKVDGPLLTTHQPPQQPQQPQQQLPQPKGRLQGFAAICRYEGRSTSAMKKLFKLGYPAVKIGGRWEAHIDLIEEWWRAFFRSKVYNGGRSKPDG